jgi:hypothetical protein
MKIEKENYQLNKYKLLMQKDKKKIGKFNKIMVIQIHDLN